MSAYAGSWTPSFEGSTLSISGEISTEDCFESARPKGRRAERLPVAMGAGLRQRGATGVTVRIVDLSTDGFRVATHLELAVGTDVWLRLPGLEACHARVVWAEGPSVGCAFERPLHPAVVEMIVERSKT